MPELPEVETFRRKIEKALKGKTIKNIKVHPDKIIFAGKSPAFIKKSLLGARVKKCSRKGKYIWFDLDESMSPVFHLGMTGSYLISKSPPDKSIKSVKLILEMSDGTLMIFKDPRRFGRIIFLTDPENHPPLSKLGPDVMNELPPLKELQKLFMSRKAPIKGVLLDQTILAGIGNWMADEILFQSGIDPHRKGATLTPSEIKILHKKISTVTKLAVKVGADDEKYPKDWLFHRRWGKKSSPLSSGHLIRHDTVAGRTTAWVPGKQK